MATDDFFRARLENMIDLRHPLAVLARRMPWQTLEAVLAPSLAHRDRKGRLVHPSSTLTARKSLICFGRGSKAQTTKRAVRVRRAWVSAVGGR